jgi:BirA family transcriptional regulator, biotin operon repressor / biotin---[acetyl-CoA-carboxylase] ligase
MSPNCILERVANTESTNDDLLARWRAGELIEPVARIAQIQTAGKGRAGRQWASSPKDSLCFSLAYPLNRRPNELSGLSLVMGLATISGIAKALNLHEDDLFQQGLRLKWPNDLLHNGAKLGGILIEGGQAKAQDPTWMIIGLGLNLANAASIEHNLSPASKVATLDQLLPAPSVMPDLEWIWIKLVESFETYLSEFDRHGFSHFQSAWSHWDAFYGQAICISGQGQESLTGTSSGVDETGALLIQQADTMLTIHAGDVSLRVQT